MLKQNDSVDPVLRSKHFYTEQGRIFHRNGLKNEEKKNENKQNIFNLRDFIFYKCICKMYILADNFLRKSRFI